MEDQDVLSAQIKVREGFDHRGSVAAGPDERGRRNQPLRHRFPRKLQKPHITRGSHTSNEQILSAVVPGEISTGRRRLIEPPVTG
ncbi:MULTISPECIES: hypothetical protein [unclassified Rathayibacter]|uniref:hypothetical protein n=1 Tax=unclassified Rathayibacter TaxID=2609250 RepID=UPI001FB3AF45|nr:MULTISPECIES: hypothetical protein [unclassified Rathayibacter]MCJ1683285.1 hypothetical protein [Rathayibacter sp. VKM Ac-2928]MCJ1688171.1 hypothetical protein [Rathayibacter sp. VKM Ac-2927]